MQLLSDIICAAAGRAAVSYTHLRVASDGEGATHLIEVEAYGLPTEHDARLVAKSIAGSMLFKAAVFGLSLIHI